MALNTYTTIADNVARWLNRTDHTAVTDRVEDFILLAQNHANRQLKINGKKEISNLTVNAESEDVPSGLTEIISITYLGDPLEETTLNDVLLDTNAGTPCKYAHVGDKIYFGPAPSEDTVVRVHYYKKPDDISTSNATNWYTTNAPEVILYRALVEAYLFLKDDNRVALWKNEYNEAINNLNIESFRTASGGKIIDSVMRANGGPLRDI